MSREENVYIGRACHYVGISQSSKWSNPFSVKKYGRDKALELYEEYAKKELYGDIHELDGKNLGCWCHPEACHGDVLMRLLEESKVG